MVGKKITNYFPDGKSIEESETYNYTKNNNFGDNFLTSKITTNPDKTIEEYLFYPFHISNQVNTALLDKHNFPIIQKETYLNSKNIGKNQSSYGFMPIVDQSSTLLAPSSQNAIDLNTNEEYEKINYNLYDDVGNILQYTPENSLPISLIWGYNKTRIIAKVEGATYSQVKSYITDIVSSSNQMMANSNYSNDDLVSKLDNFRTNSHLKDYQITTYTYHRGGIGLKTVTNPSGYRENYTYDSRNRLQKITDKDNKTIKEWDYNYSSTTLPNIFFNAQKSQPFTRSNCGSNAIGGTYIYVVPEGKYFSDISQSDADQQAQNDIDANGQTEANTYGTCTYLVDCGFAPNSIIPSGNVLTKSVKLNGNTVNFNLSFSPQNVSATWSNPTLIGYIPNSGCRPSANIYSSFDAGNNSWDITTQPNGTVIIQLTGGNINSTTFLPPITIVYSYTK